MSETKDGDEIRIRQIQQLILQSKYSIHDLSRILPKKDGELPRFNMPFELGVDLGCKTFLKKDKKCLILEEEKYRYKQFISDISGQDISNHANEPIEVIKAVRNWIYKVQEKQKPKPYTIIWDLFNEFVFDFDKDMKAENLNPDQISEIPFSELIYLITQWIKIKTKSSTKYKA